MVVRRLECLSVALYNLNRCCVLRLYRTLVHRLILAIELLAASAILAHATIDNGWPIRQEIIRVMRNLPDYPYLKHVTTRLAESSLRFQRHDFLRRP